MAKVYILKKHLQYFSDSIYQIKGDSSRKRFHDFENGIKIFEKIKSGDIKLEETKNIKICLNQI